MEWGGKGTGGGRSVVQWRGRCCHCENYGSNRNEEGTVRCVLSQLRVFSACFGIDLVV